MYWWIGDLKINATHHFSMRLCPNYSVLEFLTKIGTLPTVFIKGKGSNLGLFCPFPKFLFHPYNFRNLHHKHWSIYQFSSVHSFTRVWLCDSMDCSTPGLPVHHQLPEFIQNHVHWVSDAIQPSYPLSSPSPPAFILSQHQSLFE